MLHCFAAIAFATALTGCGGNKNNSKNETSAHSSATSENSKNEDSKSDDKNKVESKVDSMTDDASVTAEFVTMTELSEMKNTKIVTTV